MQTLDQQAQRAYQQMRRQGDDLAKNVYMEQLHDRNEVLYYRVLADHLAELLPIVYDPVIGDAISLARSTRPRHRRLGADGDGPIQVIAYASPRLYYAIDHNLTLKQAALAKGVSEELFDKVVQPLALTRPGSADVPASGKS